MSGTLPAYFLHHTSAVDQNVAERLDEFYAQAGGMIQRSLNLGISMNLVRPCDTRLTSFSIIGAVKEVVFQLTSSQEQRPSTEVLVRQLLEFAMDGILVHSHKLIVGYGPASRKKRHSPRTSPGLEGAAASLSNLTVIPHSVLIGNRGTAL